jgi:ABC-type transport system substrate-binding protein
VESGDADFTGYRGLTRTSSDLFARIKTQYAGQWHVGSGSTNYVSLNMSIPPFDNVDVRRAFDFAIDRSRLAELNGGLPDAVITCQFLPPTMPGYRSYCPYTVNPDEFGHWSGPDVVEGQRLADASGAKDASMVVGPTFPQFNASSDYLASVLKNLGYAPSVEKVDTLQDFFDTFNPAHTAVWLTGWTPDYLNPSNFLALFKCPDNGGDTHINHCDPAYDAAFDHALGLQVTDQAAAVAEWQALDKQVTDDAMALPVNNAGADFVSARVGHYQYNPFYEALFDQMWVQ